MMLAVETDWRRVWQAIEARRTELGWSKARLYEESNTSEPTFTKMKRGEGIQRIDKVVAICRALGWTNDSIDRLLRGEPAMLNGGGEVIPLPQQPASGVPPDIAAQLAQQVTDGLQLLRDVISSVETLHEAVRVLHAEVVRLRSDIDREAPGSPPGSP
jgi:hypothetical protein